MLRIQTPSVPTVCPDCGSDKFGTSSFGPVVCYDCGLVIDFSEALGGSDETVLVASLGVCPHCTLAGEIEEYGGAEWCLGCGLDPNDTDVSSPALADLWHDDSGIQKLLRKDKRMAKPEQKLGQFLRTCCGPHCSIEGMCPQAIKDLTACYSQSYTTKPYLANIQTGKESNNSFRQKIQKEQEAINRARRHAVIQCAKSGWFEKVIYANTPNPEQSGDTES